MDETVDLLIAGTIALDLNVTTHQKLQTIITANVRQN